MSASAAPLLDVLRVTALRAMATAASTSGRVLEVCLVDPRTILQRSGLKDLLADPKQCTTLRLPESLRPALSQGRMELGELDDPMNTWHFGEVDELFKYRLVSTHATMSGFTSIIERQKLASLCASAEPEGGDLDAELPAWEEFKADLTADRLKFPATRLPFLFAGSVLDAPAAAVYQLSRDGQVVGIAVSSEAAEQ